MKDIYTEIESRYETIPHDYNRTPMEELLREMKMAFLSAQPSHMFGFAKACEIVQKYVDNEHS